MINTIAKTKLAISLAFAIVTPALAQQTQVYWGDTHLHSKMSGDSYLMGNQTLGPDDAYRYAKGIPVVNPKTRSQMRINTPLDFLVVADHAEYLGVLPKLFERDETLLATKDGKRIANMLGGDQAQKAYFELMASVNLNKPITDLNLPSVRKPIWDSIIDAAESHNQPGRFTSFIGWEWSSIPNGSNLHRIIFTKDGADKAKKFTPFSAFDSDKPEDLWRWLDNTSKATGTRFIAMAHNGNVSKGKMFADVDSYGKPLSKEYAEQRMRWEPIYEVTQIKGDGETLGSLSPDDEFAEFETYNHALDANSIGAAKLPANKSDYARTALMRGLEIKEKIGVNPFKFGLIGSTDSHTGLPAIEENNFGGKFIKDSYPEGKSALLTPNSNGYDMQASGLAAVWATENTREAIFDAFKRKEVYATTGPRIQVRFFGGWDFNKQDIHANNIAEVGYIKGVPMGADLVAGSKNKAPSFLVQALKDPNEANLDRIQIVKGWTDAQGVAHEKVFNVVASGERVIKNNQLALVGNTVNVSTAQYTNTIGDVALSAMWTDPEFDPNLQAFYYARVLQIPTPRHTTVAAVALKTAPPKGYPTVIQERAYSSAIWYSR